MNQSKNYTVDGVRTSLHRKGIVVVPNKKLIIMKKGTMTGNGTSGKIDFLKKQDFKLKLTT